MSNSTLEDYVKEYPELSSFVIDESETMFLFSLENGEILWANNTFLEWIGYSLHEFTRKHNPVTWHNITVRDESLEADLAQAKSASLGEINYYSIRKYYVPKGGSPKFVNLFVRRFPKHDSENKKMAFFVVEVTPMGDDFSKTVREYEELHDKITGELVKLNQNLDKANSQAIGVIFGWFEKNPKMTFFIFVLLLILIFDRPVIETIKLILNLQ